MFPIGHSDDTNSGKLDGSDVPEHQDESHTANQELDSCSNKKYDSVTSHLSHMTADKTTTMDNKTATQRQASARYRYGGRNRSSFSFEKRRDRCWRDECSNRVDNKREVPSNAGDGEHVASLDTSDKMINGEAAAAELLTETVSRHHSGDNETGVPTKTMDSVDCDTGLSKPLLPSRHQEKGTRSYNVRGRSRFSGVSFSKYRDDYDDYVVQPKQYRDRKSNKQPKSVKTADAVSNDAGNDVAEDSNRDHTGYSSTVSATYSDDRVLQPKSYGGRKSNRRPKSLRTACDAVAHDAENDFDEDSDQRDHAACISAISTKDSDVSALQPKNHGGQKSNKHLKSIKTAPDSVCARNDFDRYPNRDHTACKPAVSSKNSDDYVSQRKHYRGHKSNRQPRSAKTGDNAIANDARDDFNQDAKDSHISPAVCSSAVSTEPNSEIPAGDEQNKTEFNDVYRRRQRGGYRSCRNNKGRPSYTTSEDSSTLQHRDANTQQCQNNSADTCNGMETKSGTQKHWPRKRWDRKAPDKARRSSVNSDEQLQKTTDALSHLSVEVCEGEDVQLERAAAEVLNNSSSSEQKRVKQSDVCRAITGSYSKRRRNHRTSRDDTKEPVVHHQQYGPDRENCSSRVKKVQYQRNGGSHSDARRNVRQDSTSDNYQNNYNNQSDHVDRQPESPSAIRSHNGRPPGFHVRHRPASATVQLPTS